MKNKTYRFQTLLIVLLFIASASGFGAAEDEEKPQETQEHVLQERQHFNKLKRSTRNIYKVTMRSSVVFRLQTALGYVSTIDLPEKALKVFVGDQELFKVGVYEKQVLVKPITDELDAKSNLVIVTESGRLSFDVSVGPPDTADFVLDFRLPQDEELLVQNAFEKKVEEKTKEIEKGFKEKEEKLDEKAKTLSEEKLKEQIASGVKTLTLKASQGKDNLQVNLLSLSQVGDKAYLRFSVLNYSKTSYRVLKAMVGAISEERKFLKKEQTGIIEFPSELTLPDIIAQDSYVYGVLVFDYRVLGKKGKSLFRLMEETASADKRTAGAGDKSEGRTIEIKGFPWFE